MRRLSFIALLASMGAFAQQPDVSQVEATGQTMLQNADWKGLLRQYRSARKSGLDYPALQYRTGLAAFYTDRHNTAETMMRRVLRTQPWNTDARDVLFGALWNQGLWLEANDAARLLPDSLRTRYAPVLRNGFKYAGIGGGLKKSGDSELAGDLPFGEVSAGWQLGTRTLLDASLSYMQQDRYWGTIQQPVLWLGATHYLGKGISLMPAVAAFQNSGDISTLGVRRARWDTLRTIGGAQAIVRIDSTITTGSLGSYQQSGLVPALSANWRKGRFSATLGGSYAWTSFSSDTDVETRYDVHTEARREDDSLLFTFDSDSLASYPVEVDSTTSYLQGSFDLAYTPPILGDRLRLGATASLVQHNTELLSAFGASFSLRLGKRTWLNADHLINESPLLVEQNGRLLQNSVDRLDQRTGIGLSHFLGKHWRIDLRYQQEEWTDRFLQLPYTYNTAVIGIRFTP